MDSKSMLSLQKQGDIPVFQPVIDKGFGRDSRLQQLFDFIDHTLLKPFLKAFGNSLLFLFSVHKGSR